MIEVLIERTPYLAGGFAKNMMIAATSMALGTLVGGLLGLLRFRQMRATLRAESLLTNLCRNVPSFVLLYYMAFMLPSEVALDGRIHQVPVWIKASLALTLPVIGFASDQSLGYLRQRAGGMPGAGETFVVAWVQYFLIIIMASATASVIGVDEVVGRANVLLARDDSAAFMLATYLYVSAWFVLAGLLVSNLTLWVARRRASGA
jgi:ABC-type amino acid transport system permease subunit